MVSWSLKHILHRMMSSSPFSIDRREMYRDSWETMEFAYFLVYYASQWGRDQRLILDYYQILRRFPWKY